MKDQRIQDESHGSCVDVLTNESDLFHGLEILPCRTRIRRPGGEEIAWSGEIFAKRLLISRIHRSHQW